jgi:hypothetical protein
MEARMQEEALMEEKKQGQDIPEEKPEVYTVEKDLVGWRFNRRAFLAAAGAATAAAVAGTVAGCDEGTQGPIQVVDVVVDVTATSAPPTATLAVPIEDTTQEEAPTPTDTQPPAEPPKPEDTSTPTSTIAPTNTPTPETPQAEFVRDVTVPDGTEMRPNQPFTKTWRYRNSGNVPWGQGVRLVFVSETIGGYRSNQMGGPDYVNVPDVAPGDDVDVSVNLVASATPGRYRSYWRLRLPNGEWLENNHYVEIVVKLPETPTWTPSPPPACECVGHSCGCDGDCSSDRDCGCVRDPGHHYWYPN